MTDGWNDVGTLVGGVSALVAAVVIAVQLDVSAEQISVERVDHLGDARFS
jgi:hypothetical protein